MELDMSIIAGFITLYMVEWIILKTRQKIDLIVVLYAVVAVVLIPLLFINGSSDAYTGVGILVGLIVSMLLNTKSTEQQYDIDLNTRFLLVLSTVIIMVVLLFACISFIQLITVEEPIVRNVLLALAYSGVVIFGLYQYPTYYFRFLY